MGIQIVSVFVLPVAMRYLCDCNVEKPTVRDYPGKPYLPAVL